MVNHARLRQIFERSTGKWDNCMFMDAFTSRDTKLSCLKRPVAKCIPAIIRKDSNKVRSVGKGYELSLLLTSTAPSESNSFLGRKFLKFATDKTKRRINPKKTNVIIATRTIIRHHHPAARWIFFIAGNSSNQIWLLPKYRKCKKIHGWKQGSLFFQDYRKTTHRSLTFEHIVLQLSRQNTMQRFLDF